MKAIFLLFSLLVLAKAVVAQCPNQNLVFERQGAVDNFSTRYPGCKALKANLTIREGNITNLKGLNGIISVAGDFEIIDNFTLTNLQGMENLKSIKGNFYTYNSGLTDLKGLENLTEIGANLRLGPAAKLTTLAALQNLRNIGKDIDLYGINVQNLTGLENITSINGWVSMTSLHSLTSLHGLHNLTHVGMTLSIIGALKLTNLNGLEKLENIGGSLPGSSFYLGSLRISDTPLNSLASLINITHVAEDLMLKNTALTNLQGLNNLSSLLGSLELTGNALLENVDGLEKLDSIGKNLTLIQNASLTNLNGLQNLISMGKRNEHHVDRILTITENPKLSTCNLRPICNFQQAQGDDFMLIEGNAPGCSDDLELYYSCNDLPVLSFSADTLYFTAAEGDAASSQLIQLTTSGTEDPGIVVALYTSREWLVLPWMSKSGPVSLSVNTAGLAPGTYTATVTAQMPGHRQAFLYVVLTITTKAQLTTVRINAGGDAFTASGARQFSADQYYEGIDRITSVATCDILNTTDDVLYRSGRCSPSFSYNIPMANGKVDVILHFAETWYGVPGRGPGGAGKRQFNVTMENSRKLTNFDIFTAAGGAMRAVQKSIPVTVTDGMLNIDFTSGAADLPRISAIEVVRTSLTLKPVADAYTRGGIYYTMNYGSETSLHVKKPQTSFNQQRNTYLKFELSTTVKVSSAKLRLYGYNHENDKKIYLHASGLVDDSWQENTITHESAPLATNPILSSVGVTDEKHYYELDVSSYVKAQLAAGDAVVSFLLSDRNARNTGLIFNSRENSNNPPQLILQTQTVVNSNTRLSKQELTTETQLLTEESTVYPNPVRHRFTVSLSMKHAGLVSFVLINQSGHEHPVQAPENTRPGEKAEVNITNLSLSTGIYLLKINSDAFTEIVKILVTE